MTRWLIVFVLASCGGDGDDAKASSLQCEQVRDRLVELRLADAHDLAGSVEDHRDALTQALGDRFLEACAANTTDGQAECVLGAKDLQAAAECTAITTRN